ncbi:hypothetical protein B0H11DRAFT_1923075 [Mycena galericulata]|nr:hypothetical protein B0H11DRAFT_1923075 [Mycena galericulata]
MQWPSVDHAIALKRGKTKTISVPTLFVILFRAALISRIAAKLFSILPSEICDGRTASRLGWFNAARRSSILPENILIGCARLYDFYTNEQGAYIHGETAGRHHVIREECGAFGVAEDGPVCKGFLDSCSACLAERYRLHDSRKWSTVSGTRQRGKGGESSMELQAPKKIYMHVVAWLLPQQRHFTPTPTLVLLELDRSPLVPVEPQDEIICLLLPKDLLSVSLSSKCMTAMTGEAPQKPDRAIPAGFILKRDFKIPGAGLSEARLQSGSRREMRLHCGPDMKMKKDAVLHGIAERGHCRQAQLESAYHYLLVPKTGTGCRVM